MQKLDLGKQFSFYARKIFMEKVKSRCSTNDLRKDEKKKLLVKVTQIVPTATSRYLGPGLTLVRIFCKDLWLVHAKGAQYMLMKAPEEKCIG